jgi:hypothetical protein
MFRTQARAVPPGPHGTSLDWLSYFTLNTMEPSLPWDDPYRLTPEERTCVGPSIQQFQLGESSEGRGLLRRARQHGQAHSDPQFPEAVLLFIQEEQRHSRILGRFLDLNGISRLGRHWVDTVFRRVRALAGLELCMRVLATAEIIAVPYYTVLGKATSSPLLAKICANILADEAAHLQFQSFVFALMAEGRPAPRQAILNVLHDAFLQGTMAVVWLHHAAVFRAAGSSFRAFRAECRELLRGMCSARQEARERREGLSTKGAMPRAGERAAERRA